MHHKGTQALSSCIIIYEHTTKQLQRHTLGFCLMGLFGLADLSESHTGFPVEPLETAGTIMFTRQMNPTGDLQTVSTVLKAKLHTNKPNQFRQINYGNNNVIKVSTTYFKAWYSPHPAHDRAISNNIQCVH